MYTALNHLNEGEAFRLAALAHTQFLCLPFTFPPYTLLFPGPHLKGKPSALPLLPRPSSSGWYSTILGSLFRALPTAFTMPG